MQRPAFVCGAEGEIFKFKYPIDIWIQISIYKYQNTNIKIQISTYKYQYTNINICTNIKIQISKYKYQNTNIKIQISKYPKTNTNATQYLLFAELGEKYPKRANNRKEMQKKINCWIKDNILRNLQPMEKNKLTNSVVAIDIFKIWNTAAAGQVCSRS